MRPWQDWLLLVRLAFLAFVVWFVLDGLPHIVAWRQRTYGPSARAHAGASGRTAATQGLGITTFTAAPPSVEPGQPVSICYGVTNAQSVSIQPPVAQLHPSPHHCFQVTPAATTRFTLTAEDAHRSRVSRSFTLTVRLPAGAR